MQGLFVMLLLSGCASGQFAGPLSRMDSRIDQAPMTADTKSYARGFFNRPSPKAFAFSPEKGTAWAAWGSSSVEKAKDLAMRECEQRTRTPCTLFAVDQQIVWEPAVERPAKPPQTIDPVSASAAKPDVLPWAERIAVHVASVRNPAEARGEWQRLAERYRALAGLEPQAPTEVEVPGKGIFYRVIGGAFTTRGQAQAVCDKVRSAGGYCTIVAL
jgi:hypothetical protein